MKKFIFALLFTLFPICAFAQNQGDLLSLGRGGTVIIGRVNETQADLASSEGAANFLALTKTGAAYVTTVDSGSGLSQSVVPVNGATSFNDTSVEPQGSFNVGTDTIEASSTTTVLNLTSHAARKGDWIIPTGGTAANVGLAIKVCSTTTDTVTLCNALAATPSTDAIVIRRANPLFTPLEDSAHTSGDPGLPSWSIQNDGWSTLAATGDYIGQAAGRAGNQYVTLVIDDVLAGSHSPIRNEDAAFANLDPVIVAGGQSLSAIAQSVNASGDVAPPALDLGNRTIVTGAPSGEMVVGCNTAVTTNTTGSMIAAVASKFTFITSWQCTNTGGAASRVILEDGDGTDLANLLVAATTGFAQVTFPTPVRTNVVNKAIQINVITTGTSTICCASGYTGAI